MVQETRVFPILAKMRGEGCVSVCVLRLSCEQVFAISQGAGLLIMVGMRVRRGGKKVISLMINVSVVSTQDSSAHTLTQTHTH